MGKKRILILGAGLAGLSAAWHLQRKEVECHLFEKETEVGGLCRSKKIRGFIFDCDGHLLHFRHRYTFNLIKSLLGNNLLEHERNAWIYSHNRFSRYPFQANLYGLPQAVVKECLLGFVHALNNRRLKNKNNLNFLQWINYTFGRGIARHFMVPYNSKFWTLPPEKLTCAWLDGFIPTPSLSEIIEGTLEEGQRQFGYNARFWYPKKGGINQLPLALASRLKNIHTNCQITEINFRKKEIKLSSGNKERFDHLISTLPLPEMPRLIKEMPTAMRYLFKKLNWNSIFNLNLGIEHKVGVNKHWVYFPEKKFSFFRVGFFHNFSSSLVPVKKSSLYIEVAYAKDKTISKDKVIPQIKEDLIKSGILTSKDKVCAEDVNDIKYGYPIYDKNYTSARTKILNFLSHNSIICCGRYGSWRYMSMEDAILDGRGVARRLSGR